MTFTRLLLIGLCLFIGYEGWRVWRAYQATPQILAAAISPTDIDWSDLTDRQQDVLLKVEDPNFFRHRGLDFTTPGAGLTTLTQALTKRLYFDDFTPGIEKIEQILIARLVVHPQISKQEQLSLFLNHAYFGHSKGRALIGFPAASLHFFDKPVLALSNREYMSLVAALVAPNTHPPGTPNNDQRTNRIIHFMTGACKPANNGDVWLATCGR